MEDHMMRRFVLASIAAAGLAGVATVGSAVVAPADAQVSITFGSPPPPLRYEAVPAPRAGYVWAPGHWRLVRDQYVWYPGQWYTARPGYRYVPETWQRVVVNGRDQWRFVSSRWDRDGDGVPDRYERPRNWDRNHNGVPDRYESRRYRDRDRDGIPDRYERFY
jgi:hypothetical protein